MWWGWASPGPGPLKRSNFASCAVRRKSCAASCAGNFGICREGLPKSPPNCVFNQFQVAKFFRPGSRAGRKTIHFAHAAVLPFTMGGDLPPRPAEDRTLGARCCSSATWLPTQPAANARVPSQQLLPPGTRGPSCQLEFSEAFGWGQVAGVVWTTGGRRLSWQGLGGGLLGKQAEVAFAPPPRRWHSQAISRPLVSRGRPLSRKSQFQTTIPHHYCLVCYFLKLMFLISRCLFLALGHPE